jgi:glycosyltransferase involved in cell wall biosynthesis
MPSTVLNGLDMHTGENSDRKNPQQSVRGSRISICHVSAGDAWAGIEVQVATLLRALSKRPEVSLYAIVLYDGRLAQELRSFGVTVHVVSEQQNSFPRLISGCAQFVKGKNIQILHSNNYKENLVALLLSHSCKVPYLVRTQHGLPEPYSIARNLKHWFVLAADHFAAKYTRTRIVGVSSDLGEYWKRHVDPRRVVVVHNGVDLKRVHSGLWPGQAKKRLGIAGDSFVVGIAARLEGIKRLDLFVATARYLADRIPKSAFVIAGEGSQKEPLQRLILQSGLRDRVALLGERNDVYDVLRAMDVLLICSDHEGIPMVMLEAMALGVAVVSRKVGGIPEVIRDRVTGILVPSDSPEELGRACMLLFERPRWRADLAQVARDEIHQRYSADKNAEIMVELYRSICR